MPLGTRKAEGARSLEMTRIFAAQHILVRGKSKTGSKSDLSQKCFDFDPDSDTDFEGHDFRV
jgi:hypothetical protein